VVCKQLDWITKLFNIIISKNDLNLEYRKLIERKAKMTRLLYAAFEIVGSDETTKAMKGTISNLSKLPYGVIVVKRGRKWYLGVTTITQDVEDFLKSTYGRPIITNSALSLLLKQSPVAAPLLKDVFKLTDAEKDILVNARVGEGIFFAGLKHVPIKIVASYTEDKIITTSPEQLLAIKREEELKKKKNETN